MKLTTIFEQLRSAEFTQLSIGGQARGEINDKNYGQVIHHINLGLADLYTRFLLKKGQVTLSLKPGITSYTLDSKYAVSNTRSREPVKYLEDSTGAKFLDDVIRIEQVFLDNGVELVLNDYQELWSVKTPMMNVLVVPKLIVDATDMTPEQYRTSNLDVVYRANHPIITPGLGYFDPATVTVLLPQTHLMALCLFIASRVNNPIGMSNEFHAGNSYAAKYEQECLRLKLGGMEIEEMGPVDRVWAKGFV